MYSLVIGATLSFGICSILVYRKGKSKESKISRVTSEILLFIVSVIVGGWWAVGSWVYPLQIMWVYFAFVLIFTYKFVFEKNSPPLLHKSNKVHLIIL